MVWNEFISWLCTVANITHTHQIDWIVRVVCIEISFCHCKKNSYGLKLRFNSHLSLQLRLRETSLSRRLTNAAWVVAMECRKGGMVTLWWENKTRGRDTRGGNPSMYRKELSTALFHRANFFIRSWFILRQHCSSRQQERCRQRRFARTNSSAVENAFFIRVSQAHQAVTTDPNLDIQHNNNNNNNKHLYSAQTKTVLGALQ